MPIESHIDEVKGRIVATVSGTFTTDEILATLDRSVRDPKFRPGMSVLSDHTAVEQPLTPDQARQMVEHLVNLSDAMAGVRWAVVTTSPASYGMIRMLAVLAERVPIEVQIFPSVQEAEAWLDAEEGSHG